jgi:hypothetical protein
MLLPGRTALKICVSSTLMMACARDFSPPAATTNSTPPHSTVTVLLPDASGTGVLDEEAGDSQSSAATSVSAPVVDAELPALDAEPGNAFDSQPLDAAPSGLDANSSTLDARRLDAEPGSTLDAGEVLDSKTGDAAVALCTVPVLDSATDRDQDGLANTEDQDDDDDGVPDADDEAPLDPALPFTTALKGPASVMHDPCMIWALERTAHLHVIPVHLGHCYPDVSGYYLRPDLSGQLVAEDDLTTPAALVGAEFRFDQVKDQLFVTEAAFTSGASWGWSKATRASLLRGDAAGYTAFGRDAQSVGISSATLSADGAIIEVWSLSAGAAPEGATVCPEDTWWSLTYQPMLLRVDPATFDYMCLDGDHAYVPSEMWHGPNGSCACNTSLEVQCSEL